MIARILRRNASARTLAMASLIAAVALPASRPVSASAPPTEPAAPLSIAELLAGLGEHEAMIGSMSCAVGCVEKQYFSDHAGVPLNKQRNEHDAGEVRRISIGNWTVASSGKSWCKRTGKTTFVRADGSDVAEAFESEAAFDGSLGRHMHARIGSDGFRRPTAIVSDGFVDEGPSPLEYTTHWLRLAVSRVIEQRNARIVSQETWDDRPVVVAETAPTRNGQEFKTQFWVDRARGFIVVRRLGLVRYGEDGRWHVNQDVGSLAHREISPGIWLPEKIEAKVFAVPASEPAELPLAEEVKGRFSEWQVNEPVPDAKFQLKFPPELRARVIRFFPGPDRT
jgi:hypothetical protein